MGPGGHLLLTTHAAMPPWATGANAHTYRFLTPEEDLAEVSRDPDEWERRIVEVRPRQTTAPDGSPAHLDDGVILLRRR